jgi:hypothetical protein
MLSMTVYAIIALIGVVFVGEGLSRISSPTIIRDGWGGYASIEAMRIIFGLLFAVTGGCQAVHFAKHVRHDGDRSRKSVGGSHDATG